MEIRGRRGNVPWNSRLARPPRCFLTGSFGTFSFHILKHLTVRTNASAYGEALWRALHEAWVQSELKSARVLRDLWGAAQDFMIVGSPPH
jgi:hypothetical protein